MDINARNLAGAAMLALTLVVGVFMARAQERMPADAAATRHDHEAAFLVENAAAMDRMMAGMHVHPTGDVDADFAAMMVPHHQGAIDMAFAYLRVGGNEQLRRIAQEIIIEQQQEIAAMRLALGQPLPPSTPAPTEVSPYDQPLSRHVSADDHATTAHGCTRMPVPDQMK